MSRKKNPTQLTLPEVIRAMRKRRFMTTSEFARELGVAQSVVSRYESGGRSPGWRVLVKLLLFAEGVEREPVLQALSEVRGSPVNEADAEQQAARFVDEDKFLRWLAGSPDVSERGQFARLAAAILSQDKMCVDQSLNTMLELWLRSSDSPALASRYFRDAARFLEVALLPVVGNRPMMEGMVLRDADRSPTAKAEYRVLIATDFGDGVIHAAGDVVELDGELAAKYSTWLQRVEKERIEENTKKSA
jgi:transcriptional regulator with XRE-family HTH domain